MKDNRAIVRRFYEVVWNEWDRGAAADIVAADICFRGSLGTRAEGIDGFLRYVDAVARPSPTSTTRSTSSSLRATRSSRA